MTKEKYKPYLKHIVNGSSFTNGIVVVNVGPPKVRKTVVTNSKGNLP